MTTWSVSTEVTHTHFTLHHHLSWFLLLNEDAVRVVSKGGDQGQQESGFGCPEDSWSSQADFQYVGWGLSHVPIPLPPAHVTVSRTLSDIPKQGCHQEILPDSKLEKLCAYQ